MSQSPKPRKRATRKTAGKNPMAKTSTSTKSASPAGGKTARKPRSTAKRPEPAPSYEQIRDRAYFIFLERGATHGNEMEDWLQAERELTTA